jgi:hypothetical protein
VLLSTGEAKNDLEAYIISTREKLETNEALQQVGSVCACCDWLESTSASMQAACLYIGAVVMTGW